MALHQRLFVLSTLVALALLGGFSRLPVALADGSGSASATVRPQCASSIKAADAPVRGPLTAVVGSKLVDTIFNFITDTPFGKLLAGPDAYTCIANMNGTVLGDTLVDRLKTPTCAPFSDFINVTFVRYGLDILTANASATPTFTDVLKYMKDVPNDQMEQFCGLYTKSIVPCVVSEFLPTLSLILSKYANGCCGEWSAQVLADYGYTISGQLTKMAQLFGDVMCATQTPGLGDLATQRCGTTLLETVLPKADTASFAATVLRNLQVPTDQMCLRAEGKPYTDTNNNSVAASEPTPSGCVITLDRITSWVYGLPSTRKSDLFDMRSFLEDGNCIQGSEFFPTVKYLFPALALEEVEVYFDKSCVHLPMQFGDKCSYSRPALLVEWESEPKPVAKDGTADPGSATAATATSSPQTETAAPSVAPASSSSIVKYAGTSGVGLVVLIASGLAL